MPRKSPHPHVNWRDGRPRFDPAKDLRDAGHKGKDLRHEDGRWFTRGEAVDWSDRFVKELAAAKTKTRKATGKRPVAIYTVAQLFEDWQRSPRFQRPPPEGFKPNTIIDLKYKLSLIERDHPMIWNAPVRSLEQPTIRSMFEKLWTERGLASARGAVLTLSAAISWGQLNGRVRGLPVNPCFRIRMSKPAPRVRFATRKMVEAFIAAADHIGRPEGGDMIVLALWTGQRQNDRISLQEKGLHRNRRLFRQAKTGAMVAILQAPELEARRAKAQERRKAVYAEAMLRATDKERRAVEALFSHFVLDEQRWVPFSGDHWSRTFAEIRKVAVSGAKDKAGRVVLEPCPECEGFWDLDWRDTSVTWMALAGATIPEIISVTGHSIESATEVLKHYLARHPEMADEAMRKMITWYDAGGETEIGL
ncbi:hypothetical protein JYU29_05115 [Tianweitania sp. BSSL-BM11]|uniref:Tyr recombinase domain-containing protein n=1 Tax=Tianweitania aestuarii TaxID=2814886 RepID=A0ABS5RSY0_9HYPH|nr:hypothetical protein [Tianweitania aestuarii]MBS9720067.1 hypothetical protein [Tianweitania aestuarii]